MDARGVEQQPVEAVGQCPHSAQEVLDTRAACIYTRVSAQMPRNAIQLAATKHCHCLAARRNARAITRLYEEKLRPHGLRATQFSVLAALALKGPTRTSELADFLGLERTTLTRSAALLERNGWVGAAQARNARQRPLRVTPAGRRKLEAAFPAWKQAQDLVDRELAGAGRRTR